MTELFKSTTVMSIAGVIDVTVGSGTSIINTIIIKALVVSYAVFAWEFIKKRSLAATFVTVEYRPTEQFI